MTRPLDALRAELKIRGLDGFIVPHADEYQNEFIPPCAERLAWVTGFTGSAGAAIILAGRAALFIDGRYTLQARAEVDDQVFSFHHLLKEPPAKWIGKALPPGGRLGYDPWLHTSRDAARWWDGCKEAGGELVAVESNPLDAVWRDRPPPPCAPIEPHGFDYAGKTAAEKIAALAADLRKADCRACVLSGSDSIAWLFNIRGGDVSYTPLPLAFAIVDDRERAILFTDPAKTGPALAEHLGPAVELRPPGDLAGALKRLGKGEAKVWIDPARSADWLFARLREAGGRTHEAGDPCQLPKACKNPVEIAGARAAHRRDGVALACFLHWLEQAGRQGGVDEITAADQLHALRAEDPMFRQPSFETISGSGPNGAAVHYRVTPETNRRLQPGDLYLLDSGGQYPDGTTDVTRTVFIGGPGQSPDDGKRAHFTHVLKGHIALAAARFPKGTTGAQLDPLARAPLWRIGLDYDHGTGHGVGSYLGVHEGPQRVAKSGSGTPLQPGMIISNEPGYYRPGDYGIRIENLLCVNEPGDEGGGQAMLSFETLTLAPIDRRLIDPALLTADELAWLDDYHRRVRAELTPLLDGETAAWLAETTRPLAEG